MSTFTISSRLVEEMVAHARREAPYEACGMIGGVDAEALGVYPTTNPDASQLTYTIAPKEAFDVIRKMRQEGVDFIACYHSHPATEAYPSPTDRSKAGDADLIYVIVSLRDPGRPEVRAFRIVADQVNEVEVLVT